MILLRTEVRTREAVQVNRTEQLKEANTVFWELGEVLVDHVQRGFEDRVQNGGHLGREQGLPIHVRCAGDGDIVGGETRTPRRPMIVAMTFSTSASRAAGTFRL